MRIAMIGTRGVPARAGGAERVVHELTRELTARGHDVLVYCRKHYVTERGGTELGRAVFTPGLRGKHADAITHTATALLDVLRRDVDVVHLHSPGPALLSWIPAMAHLPLVLTIHAPDWRRDKWSPAARAILRAGLRCGLRCADVVTAVSRPLAEELSERFGREVVCVPNAVRPAGPPRPPEAIRQWGLNGDDYVLYVGRVEPEKRLDLLLDAARDGLEGGRKLVVAADLGDGSCARRCRQLAGKNVLLVGPQFGAALEELYNHASLLVQPSVLEGMSLVLLEAAAHGRCILAARIAENVATMGQSILYFEPDQADDLREQICKALQNKQLRESLGSAAREHVAGRYRWQAVAERMESLYAQATRRRPHRRV